MSESAVYPVPPDFAAKAHVNAEKYASMYAASIADPEAFWREHGKRLRWMRPYTKVKNVNWDISKTNDPSDLQVKWFEDGTLNVSVNCIDRHLPHKADTTAFIFEGDDPSVSRHITYAELYSEVCRFANVLKTQGVKKGDRVTIYMPMIPEAAYAMLACARIGAIHSVVFGGFSAEALKARIQDLEAKVVLTADGGWRRGKEVELKSAVDLSLEKSPSVRQVVVLRRTGSPVPMVPGRDHWWHDLMAEAPPECEPASLDSEHPLFILYTSGSTGKPKGVLHTTGGYTLGTMLTSKWVFDLKDEDTYWCTADVGWITGHSYVCYGPLANGTTVMMYEGAPNWPNEGRFWELIEKYKVTIFYTAPTAIRSFIRWGDDWPNKYDLSSLRLLGSVGEPINPEAWMWYHKVIGGERCPIVDTWWQTETGSIMISPLPGATVTKPGSCTRPLPGVVPEIVTKEGEALPANTGGLLVMKQPWPSMLRTLYGDHERFLKTYFSEIPGCYFAGDGARKDEDGCFWVMGRVDDVLNVSGHRLSTMEVESALVSHPLVAESAVVGFPHEIKGEGICCFVTLTTGDGDDALKQQLKEHVRKQIGALATPDMIRFTSALPKTRSGKIMRRLLRDIAAGRERVQDTTTLEDYGVLAKLRASEE